MRRGGRMAPLFLRNCACIGVFLLVAGCAVGCATTPPARLDLSEAVANPQAHKNERVELTGHVITYEPARGDAYRTLLFTIGYGPDKKIAVFSSGYTADAIAKASALVEEAFDANEPLTVVGKLKVAPDAETAGGAELRLESVEYKGQKIDVTRGRKTRPGFSVGVGGWYFTPSVGVGATITP